MHKIKVGVIRGGPSYKYDISLKTGANVLNNLSLEKYSDKYNVRDILIDRTGVWHVHGIPTTPHDALTYIDVAFNALHGHFGEDGKIQHIFEMHGIPFTGSGSFASVISINKNFSKEIYRKEKIKTPQSKLIESFFDIDKQIDNIFKAFPLPIVLKPISSDSSLGVTIIKDFSKFEEDLTKTFKKSNVVLVEEFIKGISVSCLVINDFRNQEYYTLPVIEKKQTSDGRLYNIIPGNFTIKEKREIESMAIQAHKVLGLKHYSYSNFIINQNSGVFIIETNTLPTLDEKSIMVEALHSVGAPISYFFDHVIELALRGK